MAVPSLDYLGLFFLLKLYQTRYCFPPPQESLDPLQIHCVPMPNNFTEISEYFLQLVCPIDCLIGDSLICKQSLITALSHVRDYKGQAMPHLLSFLVGLLTYNDNSINKARLSISLAFRFADSCI